MFATRLCPAQVIQSCATIAASPTQEWENPTQVYPGSSVGSVLVYWTNDAGSSPDLGIFLICLFYVSLAMRMKNSWIKNFIYYFSGVFIVKKNCNDSLPNKYCEVIALALSYSKKERLKTLPDT